MLHTTFSAFLTAAPVAEAATLGVEQVENLEKPTEADIANQLAASESASSMELIIFNRLKDSVESYRDAVAEGDTSMMMSLFNDFESAVRILGGLM